MSAPIFEKGPKGTPIFKGFSPLAPGTYTIWSQKYQGVVVDLAGAQQYGNIQGYPTNNTNAQKWTLTPEGQDHKEFVTWEAVPLKSYIFNQGNVWGSGLAGNFPVSATWEVTMLSPTTGTIGLKGSSGLLWTLTNGAAGTQIVLQNANGDLNQVWTFTQAQ
ncbi:hypothetical protein B0H16DRAFT_1520202 [Mycena metata]|uniref:Ricin B lectin domain-containing protein n=1 Tax=Mycena metata TaxID=1033252 RepID=A0AAD7JPB9_9AGAR|nr:hypothetical protein B0H16DRAFT_333692 [Mycena metata]KAJ7767619.1 hypothetical protein B0H16DRAFT_1520202 [Mycena metata]